MSVLGEMVCFPNFGDAGFTFPTFDAGFTPPADDAGPTGDAAGDATPPVDAPTGG